MWKDSEKSKFASVFTLLFWLHASSLNVMSLLFQLQLCVQLYQPFDIRHIRDMILWESLFGFQCVMWCCSSPEWPPCKIGIKSLLSF